MEFLYDLLYDLLILSLILKLLWDADLSSLSRGLVAFGVVGAPFLLGMVGRRGLTAVRVVRLGVGDQFVEHGSQRDQRAACSIDREAVVRAARGLAGDASP